ncbi:MAG TPA: long-chain fatty acid--CoA ligase [Bacteroidota bacterium]|nr:long-chain fatty acid--CoA ligase [Bacteroidota bacterium]
MSCAVEFDTIPRMFDSLTERFAGARKPILMAKSNGVYNGIPYSELRRQVEQFALGLSAMGLRRGDRVSIISENRPEWVVADQAIAALGAVSVPVYPTMTARQIEYIFNDASVRFAIVSNQFQLNKVARIAGAAPSLEKTILMGEAGAEEAPAECFARVMEAGERFRLENPGRFAASIAMVRPEDLLTIIYTSGTTGNPKGVMLTHDNLCTNIRSAAEVIPFGTEDILLSFLPLSHSFERMAGYYTGISCGATVAFAESVETVRDNMLEVRPTIVTTVPRLFERIQSRIIKQVDAGSPLKRKLFSWALGVGRSYAAARRHGAVPFSLGLSHAIADRLVFSKIREKTGGRMRFFVSGGAALGREFGEFFEAVGFTVIEGYGLTESSPVISVNRLDNYRFGTVGHPIPGVDVRIAPDGEILARGPNIMRGYWNNAEATREVIDEEGWLHTGDIGVIDDEGFVHITDRKKHLFVSSGGKNIAPQPIENLFLSNKYIEQFMLIGDRRMFLTALIVPDFDALREYADAQGIAYATNSDLATHPSITELIQSHITRIQKDLAGYERVRRFTLLDRQFSVEEGELTPTQKVRRRVIEERYAGVIEGMYEGIN